MTSYGPLASKYDALTRDIPYKEFADYYEAEFKLNGGEFRLILDLCCGSGTLTEIMASRGYELIAVDSSPDMLQEAKNKTSSAGIPPLYICQRAEKLDLFGTVDAAYCSLDAINYISPENLAEVFYRLKLFIRPEGLLIFDVLSEQSIKSLDGQTYIDETEDTLCIWRADYDEDERVVLYGIDLFIKIGELWRREQEEHIEYIYSSEEISAALKAAGFHNIREDKNGPHGDTGRIFYTAERQ